jgi:hypothetical protein
VRTFIIDASLVLTLLTGPAWGKDDGWEVVKEENATLGGCRDFLENKQHLESATTAAAYFKGECIGVIKGLTAAALAQLADLALQEVKSPHKEGPGPLIFCVPFGTPDSLVVRVVSTISTGTRRRHIIPSHFSHSPP